MAVDPLFESFPGQSPYAYAFNSPLCWSDPSGLAPEKEKMRDRVQNFDMNEYWIGYGLLQKSIAWLEDERAGNYYEEMDYRQNMHFLAQSYSSRLGECGGGGGGSQVENGQGTVTLVKHIMSDPLTPGGDITFNLKYDKNKYTDGTTEDEIVNILNKNIDKLLETYDGRMLIRGRSSYNIDITKSGSELAEYGKECDWGVWVAGVSNFPKNLNCENISGESCKTNLNPKTIYIAFEYFDKDPTNQGRLLFNNNTSYELCQLYFVLSHEFAHSWLEFNCAGKQNHEIISNFFMINIWENLNPGKSFYKFIINK